MAQFWLTDFDPDDPNPAPLPDHAMLHHIAPPAMPIDHLKETASPEICSLLEALSDCRHPRAGRLLRQLCANPDMQGQELAQVRRDARHVLCLSFGTVEASRRLSPMALQ